MKSQLVEEMLTILSPVKCYRKRKQDVDVMIVDTLKHIKARKNQKDDD